MAPPPSLPPPPLTGSTAKANASHKTGNTSTNTGSNKNTKPQQTSSTATTLTTKQRATSNAPAAAAPPRAADLLAAAPWADRALWVSRQFLGGNTINGFLRCTTSMKRTKRQRVKQLQQLQKSGGAGANTNTAAADPTVKDIVVPRVAKKLKTDLEQGMTFCRVLHETIRSLVQEMDPALPAIPPLRTRLPPVVAKSSSVTLSTTKKSLLSSSAPSSATTSKILPIGAGRSGPLSRPLPLQRATAPAPSARNTSSTTNKGSSNGTSTLRSRRKHPLPPHTFDPAEIPPNEGRTPEEQTNRAALLLRYRALRQGDVVAARLSSRDLWILARVVHAYPGPPPDFLRLNPARRDNHFRDQPVAVTDVEDDRQKASTHHVARSHVLPLPRTPVEASAWALAFLSPPRKQQHGSSNPITVYAMYPATTSLYTASVVDSTTYCHGDDDIIVVQFDGDEPDAVTGRVPHRHIPARFVVRVPPADHKSKQNTSKPPVAAASPQQQQRPFPSNTTDALSTLDDLQLGEDLPGIDDLDFDLGMDE